MQCRPCLQSAGGRVACAVAVARADHPAGAHTPAARTTVTTGTIFNAGVLLPAGACVAGGVPSGRCHGVVVLAGALSLSGVSVWANEGTGLIAGPNAAPGLVASGCKFDNNGRAMAIDARASSYALTGCVLLSNRVASDFGSRGGGAVVASNVLTGPDAPASAVVSESG